MRISGLVAHGSHCSSAQSPLSRQPASSCLSGQCRVALDDHVRRSGARWTCSSQVSRFWASAPAAHRACTTHSKMAMSYALWMSDLRIGPLASPCLRWLPCARDVALEIGFISILFYLMHSACVKSGSIAATQNCSIKRAPLHN
jgi:hypothetical protein